MKSIQLKYVCIKIILITGIFLLHSKQISGYIPAEVLMTSVIGQDACSINVQLFGALVVP